MHKFGVWLRVIEFLQLSKNWGGAKYWVSDFLGLRLASASVFWYFCSDSKVILRVPDLALKAKS